MGAVFLLHEANRFRRMYGLLLTQLTTKKIKQWKCNSKTKIKYYSHRISNSHLKRGKYLDLSHLHTFSWRGNAWDRFAPCDHTDGFSSNWKIQGLDETKNEMTFQGWINGQRQLCKHEMTGKYLWLSDDLKKTSKFGITKANLSKFSRAMYPSCALPSLHSRKPNIETSSPGGFVSKPEAHSGAMRRRCGETRSRRGAWRKPCAQAGIGFGVREPETYFKQHLIMVYFKF